MYIVRGDQLSGDSIRDEWERLAAEGLYVFPLAAGGKNPGDIGVRWQQTWVAKKRNPWPQLASAKFDETKGLWLATGRISRRVVLDIDSPEAEKRWREVLGDLFDTTLKVTTGRGIHLHFRIPESDDREWPGHSDNQVGYDFRGDGGGVVVPPSVHASGRPYEWAGGQLQNAPECLRHPLRTSDPIEAGGVVTPLRRAKNASKPTSAHRTGRSEMLSKLLDEAKEHEGDGRNNWLTSVAGHLAVLWPEPMADAYEALVRFIGMHLEDPMDEGETLKVSGSIWGKQHGDKQRMSCPAESGWLSGDGSRLYTKRKGEDGRDYVVEWADFDIKARRVVQEQSERVFYVDLHTAHTVYENEPLQADVLGNIHRLNIWLAAHHVSVVGHPADTCKVAYGTRLMRYLLCQDPPSAQRTDHYGHQADGSFVVQEGILRGGGVEPHGALVPASHLPGWSKYRYGVCDPQEARSVLREVLSFQDPAVAAVFGSWWSMALLKGRYPCSMFPFMMLDAGSESGKTTGFFALMVALAGSLDGAGQYSAASFRDAVAAHRNGITWLDDMTDAKVSQVSDIVRQATSEGSRGKKDLDNVGTTNVQLLSPIMISGEGSGTMLSEKAMRDRAVRLKFDTPKDRVSLRDPDRLQWYDILDLQARYGGRASGLTEIAGTVVGLVLDAGTPVLAQMDTHRDSGGRHSDKLAILRTGARVLAAVTRDDSHVDLVDAWCSAQVDEGSANMLLNEILPWAIRTRSAAGVPTSAKGWVPFYYDRKVSCLFVHVGLLADAWHERKNLTDRERQLGGDDAIRTELKSIGVDSSVRKHTDRGRSGSQKWYHQIPETWTAYVLERAETSAP